MKKTLLFLLLFFVNVLHAMEFNSSSSFADSGSYHPSDEESSLHQESQSYTNTPDPKKQILPKKFGKIKRKKEKAKHSSWEPMSSFNISKIKKIGSTSEINLEVEKDADKENRKIKKKILQNIRAGNTFRSVPLQRILGKSEIDKRRRGALKKINTDDRDNQIALLLFTELEHHEVYENELFTFHLESIKTKLTELQTNINQVQNTQHLSKKIIAGSITLVTLLNAGISYWIANC